MPDEAKSATACITPLRVAYEITLPDFNLVVSIPTAKPPNLIPLSGYMIIMKLLSVIRIYSRNAFGCEALRDGKKLLALG